LYSKSQARADWRALSAAAVLGSGVGLGLGAAYLAGGLSRAAHDHSRVERLAEAASDGFSETALQQAAARMDYGVLRVARRHDPFTVAGAAERDRQSAILAARLEQKAGPNSRDLMLRASLDAITPNPAPPFRLGGALEASRELECLTQAVYYEARGETPAGQAAVAQVVLNRVRHPSFPKTVCGVVFQGAGRRGCQFSFACNGAMRSGYEIRAWTRAQRVAAKALSGYVMNEVGRATHFHTTYVSPSWGPRLTRVTQVGMHVFYRFGRGGFHDRPQGPAPEETTEPVYAAPPPSLADMEPADIRLTSLTLDGEAPIHVGDAAEDAAETIQLRPAKPAEKPQAAQPKAPQAAQAKPPKPAAAPRAEVGETALLERVPARAEPTRTPAAAAS
jgi:spore germination cell wall hydrolase CwlJ-like protein